jgi:hypothetical protein
MTKLGTRKKVYLTWLGAVCLGLSWAVLSLHAQSSSWAVWLQDMQSGDIWRINQDGAVESVHRVPLVPNMVLHGDKVAWTTTLNSVPTLEIFSLTSDTRLVSAFLPTPQSGAFNRDDVWGLTPMAFDAQAQWLAYSTKIGGEGWVLTVINANDGAILHMLTADNDLVRAHPALHAGVVPLVQAILDENGVVTAVHFSIANDATNPLPAQRSFVWQPLAPSLLETVAFPTFTYATQFTPLEGLSILPDSRFEATNKAFKFRFLQTNTLQVSQDDTRFVVYANPELDIQKAIFVQDNERVLLTAYWDELNTIWVLLDRDGNEIERYRKASDDVVGVNDGFVYITATGDKTALVHLNTRDGANAKTVWLKEGQWRLLGADTAFLGVGARDSWTALASPLVAPPPAILGATPTLYPTPLPLLRVGMEAQIQTAEDEFLNLRDTPSTSGAVLALLESGVPVTIIGGPLEADGYVWWQVRVGKRDGWLVERLDELQSLIPPRPLMTATPDATATGG